MPTTRKPTPITVRQRTTPAGQTGWEAIRLTTVPETITIGLRPTAMDVLEVLDRMVGARMLPADVEIVIV